MRYPFVWSLRLRAPALCLLAVALLAACDSQPAPAPTPTAAPEAVASPSATPAVQAVPGTNVKLTDGKLVLAVINDQTGIYAEVGGHNAVEAVRMAVEEFKRRYGEQSVGPVEIVSANHQNDPDAAALRARDAYDKSGADVILDVPTSPAALAVAKVAAEKRRLYINISAATADLTGTQCNKYTFHYAYDTYMLSMGAGAWGSQQWAKKWYLIYPNYAYGQDISKAFTAAIQANGGTVLASEPSPFPNQLGEFSMQLAKVAALKPEAIVAMQTGEDLQALVRQYNAAKFKEQGIKLAVGLLFETDINALGAEALEGVIYTTPWLWTQDGESRAFADRFLARTGMRPTFVQAGNYSAAWQFLEAVRRIGTDEADGLVRALEGHKFNDFFIRNGLIRPEDHYVAHDAYVAQVKAKADMKEPWDYAKIIGSLPAELASRPLSGERLCDGAVVHVR